MREYVEAMFALVRFWVWLLIWGSVLAATVTVLVNR